MNTKAQSAKYIKFLLVSKCKLLILFPLILIFTSNFFFVNKTKDDMSDQTENDFIYYRKTKELWLKKDSTCFPTDNKLYWKNQTDLEIERIRKEIKYYKSLNITFDNITYNQKRENPKISLIITIYNQGYYIETLYWSILKQTLKDIEIIFIDDASIDNSSLIIKELIKKDKRIVYLKNVINKRQYYSINIGILNSKGEYILSVDPDDLLVNNILIKAYETAKMYMENQI